MYRLSKFAAAPPLSPEPMQLLQSSRRSTSLLALIIFLHFISHGLHAFFLPTHVSLTHLSTKTVRSVSVAVKAAGSGSESSSPKSSPLGPVQNVKRATSKAALLLGTCIGSFDTSGAPPSQAADLTPLPPEFRTAIMAMRDAAEPLSLRDAAKAVSELPGLDELLYDDASRRAINTELKELRQERPDLWDAETSYYGGVIRRAVNPFHVLELIPLLKVNYRSPGYSTTI